MVGDEGYSDVLGGPPKGQNGKNMEECAIELQDCILSFAKELRCLILRRNQFQTPKLLGLCYGRTSRKDRNDVAPQEIWWPCCPANERHTKEERPANASSAVALRLPLLTRGGQS